MGWPTGKRSVKYKLCSEIKAVTFSQALKEETNFGPSEEDYFF